MLHHVGLVAGTALVAGAGGTTLFAVVGLLAPVPLLVRLRRRFASWWAPVIAVVVYVVMFSTSAFVIGLPAISGSDEPSSEVGPTPSSDHTGHYPGK